MARTRSPLELAAGRLISAIQKVFIDEMGTETSEETEMVMDKAHLLLQAANRVGALDGVLGAHSVSQFLGTSWVDRHPQVHSHIAQLEAASDTYGS